MGKPFSPERLANIRRMRQARRLYKKQPVFAFELLKKEYPGYTHEQFWDDLRYRKRPKKKKGKSPLCRYGRYRRMLELGAQYSLTGNIDFAIQAMKLRRNMTKPYRVMVRLEGEILEFELSATIPIEPIEKLVADLSGCQNPEQARQMVQDFSQNSHIN